MCMNVAISRVLIAPLALCCTLILGCGSHAHNAKAYETPNQRAVAASAAIAQDDQQRGIMSSKDYLRWEQVGNQVSRTRSISDADLDWALSTINQPSTDPAAVHLQMIGLFVTCRTLTPEQRLKIRQAVTPLLSSSDKHDRKAAEIALRRIPE